MGEEHTNVKFAIYPIKIKNGLKNVRFGVRNTIPVI